MNRIYLLEEPYMYLYKYIQINVVNLISKLFL